ncbi:MAG: hypothetical protein A2821_01015 [Candidatus Magasanikbacteria bacterium RIFCSPHIGHO2_01_FULL_41_23]|uniref:Baseplate protein J-like domain-containing protein n=1 Tax=Candidatus Magasanikbacteria bacterium RIFCSPLOWO2_01_FULL_40_15 TaxID=1798686 RepID=A0A1F6N207_9BACT|nr:MAG: hypothetical protein A2821_01015 [Candidatus Magasanikbacteria bacterium RIFCSPHIGHO2_01_FULL_41_23]OGH66668.1 MAG: hypothetical protein A3C66_01375 [Candidatus Magasanikbacteria bacterium RIFCSPHIGHO2_02_FULL_41_35]OGH74790.1 MAG: hypothetical protein A3F22_03755 [Candidatus Magasanikbacteria bacterium RIFCSPHIGHO2_12_FULL_41_16]OGH77924.1 MAG: hypothetical protein A2983_00375 [Candidatus Magasanikbacteria bacterium RIFCSPLOWO2_01_FULL_40_15]
MVHTSRATASAGYGQPVRFYKGVAITFLCLTIALLSLIAFMSAKRVEITIVTKADSVDISVPVEVGTNTENAIKGNVTSTIIMFEKSFTPRTTTTTVSPSTGSVTLYNDSGVDQPLVATTRLLTNSGVLYRLKKGTIVPANGKINSEVYPDKSDSSSDIEASRFTIPGLSESRQKEVYAKSTTSLSATGVKEVGIITSDDIKLATAAFVEALKVKANELAKEKYQGDKVLAYVAQYTADSKGKIGDTVDSFTIFGKATLVLANFKSDDLTKMAIAMLNKKIVDNSDILQSASSEPNVSFDSYNSLKNILTLKVTQTGTVNLDPNSLKLQKQVFFGKTEDEVRRYVMSLDHVESVEMKFKPLWNTTVPQVADHVKLTIKQVE